MEPDTYELAVHLHVLHATVRLEQRPQAGLVDARDDEVLLAVALLAAEELVADRAADDIRVEPERADVRADRSASAILLVRASGACAARSAAA